MIRSIAPWAPVLALGAFALEWLDYKHLTRTLSFEMYIALIASAFAAGGIWLGAKLTPSRRRPAFDRNTAALRSLGLTRQEMRILEKLAAGRSNKEIAADLGVSPNTVKTHVGSLYAKLEVSRRTQAVGRARELELIP